MARKRTGNKQGSEASGGFSKSELELFAKYGVSPEELARIEAGFREDSGIKKSDERGGFVDEDSEGNVGDTVTSSSLKPYEDDSSSPSDDEDDSSLSSRDEDDSSLSSRDEDDSSSPSEDEDDNDGEVEELSDYEKEAIERDAAWDSASSSDEVQRLESAQKLAEAYEGRSSYFDYSDEVDAQGRPIDVDAEYDASMYGAFGVNENAGLGQKIQAAAPQQPEEKKKKEGLFGKGPPDYTGDRAWALNLEELHGDNPDDWMMIYDFSYDYVIDHFNGILRDRTQSERTTLGDKDDAVAFVGIAFARLFLKAPVFRTLQEAQNWIIQTAASEWWAEHRKTVAVTSMDKQVNDSGGTLGEVLADEQGSTIDAYYDAQGYIDSIRNSGDNDFIALLDQALKMLEGEQLSPRLIHDTIEALAKDETTLGE